MRSPARSRVDSLSGSPFRSVPLVERRSSTKKWSPSPARETRLQARFDLLLVGDERVELLPVAAVIAGELFAELVHFALGLRDFFFELRQPLLLALDLALLRALLLPLRNPLLLRIRRLFLL